MVGTGMVGTGTGITPTGMGITTTIIESLALAARSM